MDFKGRCIMAAMTGRLVKISQGPLNIEASYIKGSSQQRKAGLTN